MDALKAMVAKKRKEAEDMKQRKGVKYLRRGDTATASDRVGNDALNVPEDQAPETNTAGPVDTDNESIAASVDTQEINLPVQEIRRRLRARGEPVMLFGEELVDVFRRLRQLELEAPLDVIQERQRNDMQGALEKVNTDILNADLEGEAQKDAKAKANLNREKYVAAWPEVQRRIKHDIVMGKNYLRETAYTQEQVESDQKHIRKFLRSLMALWEMDLNARTAEQKRTGEGLKASTVYTQSVEYMAPLLKHLKNRDLPLEMVPLLGEIVQNMQLREYQAANDASVSPLSHSSFIPSLPYTRSKEKLIRSNKN